MIAPAEVARLIDSCLESEEIDAWLAEHVASTADTASVLVASTVVIGVYQRSMLRAHQALHAGHGCGCQPMLAPDMEHIGDDPVDLWCARLAAAAGNDDMDTVFALIGALVQDADTLDRVTREQLEGAHVAAHLIGRIRRSHT